MLRRATFSSTIVISSVVIAKRDFMSFGKKRNHRSQTASERSHAILTAREEAVKSEIPRHHTFIHQADTYLVMRAEANARAIIEKERQAAAAAAAEVKK